MGEDRGSRPPTHGVQAPYPRPIFPPYPRPLISFFRVPPPKIQIFCRRPRPSDTAPAHLTSKAPLPPFLPIYQKLCKLDEGIMLIFVSEKNRLLFLAKGVWKCRLRNVGSLGSASVSDSLIWSGDVVNIMHCCCVFKIVVLYFKRSLNVLEWKPLEKYMKSIVPPWLFVRCFPLFEKLFS